MPARCGVSWCDMAYHSILVHADDTPAAEHRYRAAAWLAHAYRSRLTALASTGVDALLADALVSMASLPAFSPYIDTMRQRAQGALAAFGKVAAAMAVSDIDARQTDADGQTVLRSLAAYADLCVAGYCGSQGPDDGANRHWVAQLAAASGCPILLLPAANPPVMPFHRILLAWNGSAEAARALRAGVPLLQRASAVDVAIINPAPATATGVAPAAEIALTLRHHGVDARILERTDIGDVGRELLALAGTHHADLIVMGCYGHSRLREMVLGGATRSILMASTIPVLMSA